MCIKEGLNIGYFVTFVFMCDGVHFIRERVEFAAIHNGRYSVLFNVIGKLTHVFL